MGALLRGRGMRVFEAVIGLEVHAQLLSRTKAFCFAPNLFGRDPNTEVGPVSGGLPGALPVLNRRAVELAVRAGVALNCDIRRRSTPSRRSLGAFCAASCHASRRGPSSGTC